MYQDILSQIGDLAALSDDDLCAALAQFMRKHGGSADDALACYDAAFDEAYAV